LRDARHSEHCSSLAFVLCRNQTYILVDFGRVYPLIHITPLVKSGLKLVEPPADIWMDARPTYEDIREDVVEIRRAGGRNRARRRACVRSVDAPGIKFGFEKVSVGCLSDLLALAERKLWLSWKRPQPGLYTAAAVEGRCRDRG